MAKAHVTIQNVTIDAPEAQRLVRALDAYLNALYPPDQNFLELDRRETDGESGVFLVARIADYAVGCGAVRRIDEQVGELKRMYVAPSHRSLGIGAAIMQHLENWAASHGLAQLVLEAGERQVEALRFYERNGFQRIERFGRYVGAVNSVCYGKVLSRGK